MGGVIHRDPAAASDERHDLIIVGGGVYGCALALEAARRGIRPLLLERDDFGQHTSWNSLRIVHGGLRYLQSLDLKRFFESVAERRWFLAHFPDLVQPLPCLMPLYGRGLRRRSVLAAALAVNELLSWRRNEGIRRRESRIPAGRIVSRDETVSLFPAVDTEGLTGGALWYDAVMPDSQRVIIAMLRWAAGCGATSLNYVEAERLLAEDGRVLGVVARDRRADQRFEYRGPVVVNCAGPWSRKVAMRLEQDVPDIFRPSLALNLVLDLEPPFQTAVAVTGQQRGAQTYFLYPWKGRVLAGTHHAPSEGKDRSSEAPVEEAKRFVDELRVAIPGAGISMEHVQRILWGRLPVKTAGGVDLTVREVIIDHGSQEGPQGLYSVSGVKFTTARCVAEKTLRMIKGRSGKRLSPLASVEPPDIELPPSWPDFEALIRSDRVKAWATVKKLIEEEAVVDLSDLLSRRTDWWLQATDMTSVAEQVGDLLPRGVIGQRSTPAAPEGSSP
jgi:glycerol-3-phosphate dehydrogenase